MTARWRLPGVLLAWLLTVAGAVFAASPTPEPATLTILGREIVTFRAALLGAVPAERVERARSRLRQLPESAIDRPLTTVSTTAGQLQGVQFFLGEHLLFSVLHEDVDAEAGQSFDDLVRQTRERLEGARAAWHDLRDRPLLLRGLAWAAFGTLVFALLVGPSVQAGFKLLKVEPHKPVVPEAVVED